MKAQRLTYGRGSSEARTRFGRIYPYDWPRASRWLSRDPSGERSGINLYGYVGNDPTNAVDPFGLDVLYLLQSKNIAAAGQGHAAALVGDDQNGWTYYSYAPNPLGPDYTVNRYNTLADALNDSEVSRYDKYLLYYTSRQQDLNAIQQAGQDYNDSYRPFSNNCGNEAAKTVKAAVPSFKNNSFRPKVIYAQNASFADSSGGTNDLISNYYFPEDP